MTNPTQQTQHKQLALTDNNNIFTSHLQPIQRLQPIFMTDGIRNFLAQQKPRKKLIFTDSKNTFTYCFQPTQRLQPNFMTDSRTTFIHTKYNGDNQKVRIFSLKPQ